MLYTKISIHFNFKINISAINLAYTFFSVELITQQRKKHNYES